MAKNRLLELIGEDGIAVCDGAMGTMLYARGIFVNRSFDELNLSNPDLVRSVHEEYIQAGADVIETNTFSANRFKLAPHGCEDLVKQINLQAVRIAREAAGARVLVAGSIGPLGVRIEPFGPVSIEEAQAAFKEQAEALLEGDGVDMIFLETFYHLPELEQAVKAIRALTEKPIVAQVSVTEEACTPEGVPPETIARTIAAWDIDALGVNCGVGPVSTLEALEEIRAVVDLPLAAQPNAGQPRNINGRNIYLTSPEFLASYAHRFAKAGVRLIGGCCGTTPEHIKAIKEAVVAARPTARLRSAPRPAAILAAVPALPQGEKSSLSKRLVEKSFPVCVQVRAPRGCDPAETLDAVRRLQGGGVDLISIPEGRWNARMPPFAIAQICQSEVGGEAIVEYACRHRTLLRMQSELLGAYALGLRNVVLVTGAPPYLGEYPDATADLEVDSIGLTNMVRRLNQGLDLGGRSLGKATGLHVGVHLDPFAIDLPHEIRRFEWKVDAGAEFALTPPVLDVDEFAAFLPRIEHCRIPILPAVPLLTGYRQAERLRRETGAGKIPAEVLDRLMRAEKEGTEIEAGREIAVQTARALRPLVEGLQVVVPQERLADALQVVTALREVPTP